jgi:hypothetical protein
MLSVVDQLNVPLEESGKIERGLTMRPINMSPCVYVGLLLPHQRASDAGIPDGVAGSTPGSAA